MDAPFLMRGDEVENNLGIAIAVFADEGAHRLGVDRRTVDAKALSERPHPWMVLVELLASGERAPRDHLVHVRPSGVIGDPLGFDAGPGRGGDDFARLSDDVPEADALILPVQR